MRVLNGARIGLYLPENPSEREVRRLHLLARVLENPVLLCETRPSSIDDLMRGLGLPIADFCGANRAKPEQATLDAVIALGANREAEQFPTFQSRCGIWVAVDGDPRWYSGPDAIDRAIAGGHEWLGMSLRPSHHSPGEVPILAFCDVPRRPRDSREALQKRLDAHLPLLLEEALTRVRDGRVGRVLSEERPLAPPRPAHRGRRLNVDDIKYMIHRLCVRMPARVRASCPRMICLHDPTPDILDGLLEQLRRSGPFLPYSEAVEALRCGRSPGAGWVVTFDDGYKRNMTLLDVLDEHRCPAKFFLNTVGLDGRLPWFINRDVKLPGRKRRLKALCYRTFLRSIDEQGLTTPSPIRGQITLDATDIRLLVARGHDVGVHTHNHPFLTQEGVDIHYEIMTCFDRLRGILEAPQLPLDVAYPDGDYDRRVVAVMRELGARSAVTCQPGALDRARPVLELPRYCLGDADYPGFALFKTTGTYAALQRSFG
jgi:peptidoglycan/xylan/chitin deacetylase (PgdA/CDA1 family)